MSNQKKELKVRIPEDVQAGRYANNAIIAHTKEEFVIDFMMAAPPNGTVVSRIIVSPGHMKRLIGALQTNLQKYEQTHGSVTASEVPPVNMGFSG